MPSLTIDGREVNVADGTTVIQAAETLGIFIPRYCYHPGLSIAGNCRICLVEIENNPKLQIACNAPVSEGMVVHTQSDMAEDGRRAVLEFLLANHPLDCPVCAEDGPLKSPCDLPQVDRLHLALGFRGEMRLGSRNSDGVGACR